jgi:hypothetical protein
MSPRVQVMFYTIESLDEKRDFSQAPAWEGRVGGFDCRLHDGRLQARPQSHYANSDSARKALERYLRAWELWSELVYAIRIQFVYSGAPGELVAVSTTVSSGVAKLGGDRYPPPSPKDLATSPLVEDLLGWVRELREGRPMLVLAYLFFTRLKYEYDNNEVRAAEELRISRKILEALRRLAAKNDPLHRRNVEGDIEPLTNAERFWITVALPRITRHVAEVVAGSNPPKLNMGPPELPPL